MLKEYIILKNASAPNSFSFLFTPENATFVNDNGKGYFADTEGNVVFSLANLFAIDTNGKPTHSVTYSFESVPKLGGVVITVTLDEEYLSDLSRTFPIVIDPSIMISSVETADTCVCSYYETTNYYTSSYLRTGMDTDFGIRRSYIKFDLPSLPSNANINIVTLDIEMLSGSTPTIYAYRCMGAWTSSTLTWSNMPNYTTTNQSTQAHAQSDGVWYSIYVTQIVESWLIGTYPNYGFVIKDSIEDNVNHWTTFYSSDAVSPHKPELNINYTITESPPAQAFPAYTDISTDALYYLSNNSLYLQATGPNTFAMTTTKSSTSGTELWYFEKVQSGIYRIESLGVRNALYAGRYRNMLTAIATDSTSTSGSLMLTAYSETNTTQLWELRGSSSEGYYFVSHAYPQLAVTVSSSGPCLSTIGNNQVWSFSIRNTADYWQGYYTNTSVPHKVNIVIDPSVITGYWTKSIFESYTAWDSISNDFDIKLYHHDYSGTYREADITFTVVGANLDDNRLAGNIGASPGSLTGDWSSVTIILSTGTVYGFNSSDYTNTDREKCFLHEIGHALKLCHPHETNYDWHPVSIMCQGAPSKANSAYVPSRPTGYDIYNFLRKW